MMFHKLLVLLVLSFSAFTFAQERTTHVLPLNSDALTLKTVFDVGLRPRLVPSLEIALCRVVDEDLKISVDGSRAISVPAEWANFDVNANDDVTTFEARDRNLYTLDEALALATEHLNAFGIGTEKLAQWEATQRAGMQKAEKGPGLFVGAGNFSDGKWYGDRKMKAGIKIMSTYQVETPFTLQYYAQWRSVLSMKTMRREPIGPPVGYEHISMAPTSESGDSESSEAVVEVPLAEVERRESGKGLPPPSSEIQNGNDTSLNWFYVLIAAAILVIIVVLVRSRKRDTSN